MAIIVSSIDAHAIEHIFYRIGKIKGMVVILLCMFRSVMYT